MVDKSGLWYFVQAFSINESHFIEIIFLPAPRSLHGWRDCRLENFNMQDSLTVDGEFLGQDDTSETWEIPSSRCTEVFSLIHC